MRAQSTIPMKAFVRKLLGERLYLHLHLLLKKGNPPAQKAKKELRSRVRFYSAFIRKGDLCFDVGANVGNRVEPLLHIGARVVAIEPQEACHTQLQQKFGRRITLVKKGVGDAGGVKEFFISDASTLSTFSRDFIEDVKEGRFSKHAWNRSIPIEMTTLDALIAQYGLPKFVKIDVEGYELEVLKGLSQPVDFISFEYMVPEQTDKVLRCIQHIESLQAAAEWNYSVGESMDFALRHWISSREMKNLVRQPAFSATEFGDIYCRNQATGPTTQHA